jgi:hypothetical protein
MPVILATQEAEIRGTVVQSQQGKYFKRLYLVKNLSQKRASGVAQGVGPEFKSQCQKKLHHLWPACLLGVTFA